MALSLFKRRTEIIPAGPGEGLNQLEQSAINITSAELGSTPLAAKSSITATALKNPDIFLKQRADIIPNIITVSRHAALAIMNGNGPNIQIPGNLGLPLQYLLGWRPIVDGEMGDGINLRVNDGLNNPAINKDVAQALYVNLTAAIAKSIGSILDPQFSEGSKQAKSKLSRSAF